MDFLDNNIINDKTILVLEGLKNHMINTYDISLYNFIKTNKGNTLFNASSSIGAISIRLYPTFTKITFKRLLRHSKDIFNFRHKHPILTMIEQDLNKRVSCLNACQIEHFPIGSKSFSHFFDSLNISFSLNVYKNKRYMDTFKIILTNKGGHSSLSTNEVILREGYNISLDFNYKKNGFDYSCSDLKQEIHEAWDISPRAKHINYAHLGSITEMIYL